MKKVKKIKKDIIKILSDKKTIDTDLSDIGNLVGIAIGKYINEKKMGFEKHSFIDGVNHGISLYDGTH